MITRQGIEAAISGLKYGNPESLKYRLVHAIWDHYGNAEADQPPENIAPESLIETLWAVRDDDAINGKKRNLSNTKSAINRDLKTAYRQGVNPEGVVIGRNNCFTMCDEAKNDLLSTVDLAGTRDAAASMRAISDSLGTIRSILAQTPEGTDLNGTAETGLLEDLQQQVQEVAEALGWAPFHGGATGPGGDGANGGIALEDIDPVAQEAADDLEDDTEPEGEILEAVWEEETPAGEVMEAGELPASTGLPLDGPIDSDVQSWAEDRDPRLLAEAFDGYLGAMERFYNQYLLIPEGLYSLPPPQRNPEETEGAHQVAAFYMGKFPVTNALFEVFVERTGYLTLAERLGHSTVYYGRLCRWEDAATGRVTYRSTASVRSLTVPGACWHRPTGPGSTLHQKRNHPVVHVALEDVLAFAAWTGKRLPTEREWEVAAATDRGLPFPWGDTWKPDACNVEETAIGDTTPVNAFHGGENELGIGDTLGNVWEWTADTWHPDAESRHQVLKGGSWVSRRGVCLSDRFKLAPRSASNICGFRLAVD